MGTLFEKVSRRLREAVEAAVSRQIVRPLRQWRNAGRDFQPIFVAGAMGSGTSLAAVALGARFQCAGVAYESAREVSEASFLHLPALSEFDSVASYAAALHPAPGWTHRDARAALQENYRATASGHSELLIDKGPNANLVRARFLSECFPESPFLLIFRDPVVNIEGFRRKWPTFGRDSLEANIRFYAETHECFLDTIPSLGERVVAVEYEQLVERHDETLNRVALRLGLRPAERSRRLHSRANAPGKGLRNVRQNRIEVVADASKAAYERLDAAEAEAIREALGPLHERLREQARLRGV